MKNQNHTKIDFKPNEINDFFKILCNEILHLHFYKEDTDNCEINYLFPSEIDIDNLHVIKINTDRCKESINPYRIVPSNRNINNNFNPEEINYIALYDNTIQMTKSTYEFFKTYITTNDKMSIISDIKKQMIVKKSVFETKFNELKGNEENYVEKKQIEIESLKNELEKEKENSTVIDDLEYKISTLDSNILYLNNLQSKLTRINNVINTLDDIVFNNEDIPDNIFQTGDIDISDMNNILYLKKYINVIDDKLKKNDRKQKTNPQNKYGNNSSNNSQMSDLAFGKFKWYI